MTNEYRPGLDALVRSALSPADIERTDEIVKLAESHPGTVRKVRAELACNQLTWGYRPCDWRETVEARSDKIQSLARSYLYAHLTSEHRSLGANFIRRILNATVFTVADFGK